jgi:hypothetical protein
VFCSFENVKKKKKKKKEKKTGGKPLLYTLITQLCVLLFLYAPELRIRTVNVRPSSGLL